MVLRLDVIRKREAFRYSAFQPLLYLFVFSPAASVACGPDQCAPLYVLVGRVDITIGRTRLNLCGMKP